MFICEDERASLFLSHHHTWPAFCTLLVVLMLPTRRLRDKLLAGHAPAMAGLQGENGPRPYYHTLQLATPESHGSLNALHVGLCKLTFLPVPFLSLLHRLRVRVGSHPTLIFGFSLSLSRAVERSSFGTKWWKASDTTSTSPSDVSCSMGRNGTRTVMRS